MNSSLHGKTTSSVEVTNISAHGIWILTGDEELFLSFENFPWFRDQAVSGIQNVTECNPSHFHWPDIDVDLTVEIIKNPESFPLKARVDQTLKHQ